MRGEVNSIAGILVPARVAEIPSWAVGFRAHIWIPTLHTEVGGKLREALVCILALDACLWRGTPWVALIAFLGLRTRLTLARVAAIGNATVRRSSGGGHSSRSPPTVLRRQSALWRRNSRLEHLREFLRQGIIRTEV